MRGLDSVGSHFLLAFWCILQSLQGLELGVIVDLVGGVGCLWVFSLLVGYRVWSFVEWMVFLGESRGCCYGMLSMCS